MKQCLGKRRIENIDDLNSELEKWHTDRNERQKGVNWQFTTDDAKVEMENATFFRSKKKINFSGIKQ